MYMSPEQVKSARSAVAKSDAYSLAVTFVHLVTGNAPYSSADSEYSIMSNIINTPLDTSTLRTPWNSFLKPYLDKNTILRPDLKEIHIGGQSGTTTSYNSTSMLGGETKIDVGQTKIENGTPLEFKVWAELKKLSNFPAKGGTSAIDVKTNGTPSLLLPKDSWISISKLDSRKEGISRYALTIPKNTSSSWRKQDIKVVATNGNYTKEETLTIFQQKKTSLWWLWLIVAFVLVIIVSFWGYRSSTTLEVSPNILYFESGRGTGNVGVKYVNVNSNRDYYISHDSWITVKRINDKIEISCKDNYEEEREGSIDIRTKNGVKSDTIRIIQREAKIPSTGYLNGHEWVDLGLPSGTKWATCNVGASTPEGYGNYYAWGETKPKKLYNNDNYTYSGKSTILPANADAATVNWGNGWRLPTEEDFIELKEKCTHQYEEYNGIKGRRYTGPNGKSIFLPAAGHSYRIYFFNSNRHEDKCDAGYGGYYWSSSLGVSGINKNFARYFEVSAYRDCWDRCSIMRDEINSYGLTIRPVCK